MYDCIIIGAGPAGMIAGMHASRKNLNVLLISKNLGGQTANFGNAEIFEDLYTTLQKDLILEFKKNLNYASQGLEMKIGEEVISLEKNVKSFSVENKTGQNYYAKSIIIASGSEPKLLGVPGETEFYGKGVNFCADYNAALYKNKDVAVIGKGDTAMATLLALSKVARKVYAINIQDSQEGNLQLRSKIEARSNISFFNQTKLVKICGSEWVKGVVIQPLIQKQLELDVASVFIDAEYEPAVEFDRLTKKNNKNQIIVDANLQTSIAGIFAAGDVNSTFGGQIIVAMGEGAKAGIAVWDYLGKL